MSAPGGEIDEVRVYDRALSAVEVQRDMNTAVTAGYRGADADADAG